MIGKFQKRPFMNLPVPFERDHRPALRDSWRDFSAHFERTSIHWKRKVTHLRATYAPSMPQEIGNLVLRNGEAIKKRLERNSDEEVRLHHRQSERSRPKTAMDVFRVSAQDLVC